MAKVQGGDTIIDKPNYDYAIEQMDMQHWLMYHVDNMTAEERITFWDCIGEIMAGEIEIKELYHKIKSRSDGK